MAETAFGNIQRLALRPGLAAAPLTVSEMRILVVRKNRIRHYSPRCLSPATLPSAGGGRGKAIQLVRAGSGRVGKQLPILGGGKTRATAIGQFQAILLLGFHPHSRRLQLSVQDMHFKAIRPNAQHGWHDIMLAVVLQNWQKCLFLGSISDQNASMPHPRLAKTRCEAARAGLK